MRPPAGIGDSAPDFRGSSLVARGLRGEPLEFAHPNDATRPEPQLITFDFTAVTLAFFVSIAVSAAVSVASIRPAL